MKLAIADPPYPPGRRARASRWYGSAADQLGPGSHAADTHPAADQWDKPSRHRELLDELNSSYEGWAIATAADGVTVYEPLPVCARVMVWVKPNAMPSPSRIHNRWEAVIVLPPEGRRTSRGGAGVVPDVLVTPKLNTGFAGAKPPAWTRWVLDALGYDPDNDTLTDLFPGSGAVATAAAQGVLL